MPEKLCGFINLTLTLKCLIKYFAWVMINRYARIKELQTNMTDLCV
jgi:hypothetical protein